VAEEYDVEQVWVGWVLQEKPDNKIILTFCSSFCIPLVWKSFLFQYFTLVFSCTYSEQKMKILIFNSLKTSTGKHKYAEQKQKHFSQGKSLKAPRKEKQAFLRIVEIQIL
jgi:hypothetical protein